jgi:hypothetical protein
MTRYRASYLHKQSLGLDQQWSINQDYWAGEVNLPVDEDDPGSETNIIQPIIESQVADIVNGEIDILVKGTGPSDNAFSRDVTQILKWIWYHNNMTVKLDEAERTRLNFGTVIWKVMWDKDALGGKGIPAMIPLSPDCFFPDPKVTDVDHLNDADYLIQTGWYSRRKLIQMFGDKAKRIKAESSATYDPRIFGEDENAGSDDVVTDQACLYEYWERKDDNSLRLVYCTRDLILADSDEDDEVTRIPTELDDYPFVMILGYKKKGRLWGMSDVEQLITVQETINDLDDQIKMNARQMGNSQVVYNSHAGINAKKWTNTPGLKIPANDHTAFTVVQPPYMPAYIANRREKAFSESELISGRSDVVEGRRSGSLRAASAILALQEAGSRRANHKKLMLQEGMKKVHYLDLKYVKEFMTTEQAFDITENGKTDYLWFRGSDLKSIPQLTLNENFNPLSDDAELRGKYKPLLDDSTIDEQGNEIPGQPMTKDAEFDIEIHIGAGMPNNKSFLYEAAVELHREGIVTTEETRETLKQMLNWPVIDPQSPNGTFAGRNMSPDQLAAMNGQPGATAPAQQVQQVQQPQQPQQVQQPQQGQAQVQVDPAMLQNLVSLLQSGKIGMNQAQEILSQLPPEALQQVETALQGMVTPQ